MVAVPSWDEERIPLAIVALHTEFVRQNGNSSVSCLHEAPQSQFWHVHYMRCSTVYA